ncbi:hypothetical protein RI054_36g136850 [Pseudoscourfieldia marina]
MWGGAWCCIPLRPPAFPPLAAPRVVRAHHFEMTFSSTSSVSSKDLELKLAHRTGSVERVLEEGREGFDEFRAGRALACCLLKSLMRLRRRVNLPRHVRLAEDSLERLGR